MISFLFTYRILSPIINDSIPDKEQERYCFNQVIDIGTKYTWGVYATSQALQKIKGEIPYGVFFGLESTIKSETTTHGVAKFDRDSSTTESVNTLALEGHVVVIAEESEKGTIKTSPRIIVLTPKQLNDKVQEARRICDVDKDFPYILKVILFKE